MLFPCRLNILVLGGNASFVELYAYGMYRIATLEGVRLFFACLLVNLLYTDDIFIKWLPSEGRPKDAFQNVFLF